MKMKYYFITFSLVVLATSCNQKQEAQSETTQSSSEKKVDEARVIQAQAERDSLKGSLKALGTGKIGSTVVTINYYSPAVRGRIIWGGLVPMDQVWVTGAHKATAIEFEGAVNIGGIEIPAGKYGLFTVPSKDEWTIILNKNWDQHLTDEYDQKNDLVRIKVTSEVQAVHQERLRYVIESEGTKGEIVVYWEKLKITLPVTALN